MNKKTMLSAMLAMMLAGCGSTAAAVSTSPAASPSAFASAASAESTSLTEEYSSLPADNAYTLLSDHQDVEDMLNHGTGVLFFGFPECPWCQYYVPMLNEDALAAGINVKYYNIYVDKTADRTWYDSIADLLDEKDSEITHYDICHWWFSCMMARSSVLMMRHVIWILMRFLQLITGQMKRSVLCMSVFRLCFRR